MKNWALILFFAVASMSCQEKKTDKTEIQTSAKTLEIPSSTVTTIYLFRHAEKDTSDNKNDNPPLTQEGENRAKAWADYFSKDIINAIYTTHYDRTQHTIYYLAKDKDISAEIYYPGELYNDAFLNKIKGQNIVIVGHSNTIPQMVNKMIGEEKYSDIDDEDYNNLYKVTFKGTTATAQLKEVN